MASWSYGEVTAVYIALGRASSPRVPAMVSRGPATFGSVCPIVPGIALTATERMCHPSLFLDAHQLK